MEYQQLEDTYEADVIAGAMYEREKEYFHYKFDAINFEFLLGVEEEGEYRNDIEKRLGETRSRMKNVENTYNAIKAQITDQEAHEAAVIRMAEKRKEQEDAARSNN